MNGFAKTVQSVRAICPSPKEMRPVTFGAVQSNKTLNEVKGFYLSAKNPPDFSGGFFFFISVSLQIVNTAAVHPALWYRWGRYAVFL